MNFNHLTYRQKNIGLLIGSVVFLIVVYFASLEKTVQLWQSNIQLEEQEQLINNSPERIRKLKSELEVFEAKMRNFSSDTASKEEYLLEKISQSCHKNKVTLVSLPSPDYTSDNDFVVETRFVKARGTFINLLFLLNEIENQFKVGRISSVKFSLEEDKKNNISYLFVNIYIQNLKKINDVIKENDNQTDNGK